jgi:hypothetical protein
MIIAFARRAERASRVALRPPVATACLAAILLAAGGAASSAATLRDGYPLAPGDTFTYKYRSAKSVQPNCTGKPTVTATSYTEVTTIQPEIIYSYPPANSAKVYPFQTKATGKLSGVPFTVNNTDYRNFVTSGKVTDLFDYGFDYVSDYQYPNNLTKHLETTRKYLLPLLRDQVPRVAKARLPLPVSFNEIINNYDQTTTTANILQSNATRQTDGSYTESGLTFNMPYSITQNSDGTGIRAVGSTTAPETWNFSLPEATANGEVIPVLVTYAGNSGTNLVPDWFPGNAGAPNPLASSGYVDKGTPKVPARCGAYAGKRATLLQMSYSNLAPVNGVLYSETDDYYVIGKIGRVCIEVTQTKKVYDQEVTGKCTTATTVHSTEGLVSEKIK